MRIELIAQRYSTAFIHNLWATKPSQITPQFYPSQKYGIYLKPDGLFQWQAEELAYPPAPLEEVLEFVKEKYGGYLAKLMRKGVYEALDDAEAMKAGITHAQAERRADERWQSEYGNVMMCRKSGEVRASLIREGENMATVRIIGKDTPMVTDKRWVRRLP